MPQAASFANESVPNTAPVSIAMFSDREGKHYAAQGMSYYYLLFASGLPLEADSSASRVIYTTTSPYEYVYDNKFWFGVAGDNSTKLILTNENGDTLLTEETTEQFKYFIWLPGQKLTFVRGATSDPTVQLYLYLKPLCISNLYP